jgi:hypothetical protein
MVRILGLGKKKTRKRLSPAARTPEAIREKYPMYQYALNEYAQTIAPGTGNDDGKMHSPAATDVNSNEERLHNNNGKQNLYEAMPDVQPSLADSHLQTADFGSSATSYAETEIESNRGTKATSLLSSELRPKVAIRSPFENDMPYATYEEHYGEAYTGGHLKYIYPNGYSSMRPRSCPWKLSIVVCLLFTWLSVFIVGHCSDQAGVDRYENEDIDDDIEVRWCGSRPLYLIWALSMLITGFSAAYCGVIGYIKCRDFVVANSRSQLPGISEGRSDYYVRIEEGLSRSPSTDSGASYRPTLYQSDGTPQFWGSHIYRPTQAAVAVTSR